MDVVVWLRGLGLERYEAVFRENDIDETVLPSLTAEDLKELGVTALGHRRKLLDAIAALRANTSPQAPLVMVAPAPIMAATTHAPGAEAVGERRHVTVMFCDLVGSTSISAGLDAEDWRDLVGSYLDVASAAVTEMGGHVAKKLGDGVMALFGYPVAQENDAERAARAALSIQRALADLNRKNTGAGKSVLNARIGIETGPVGSMRWVRFTAMHPILRRACRRWQSHALSWLRRVCSARSLDCLWRKSAGPMT
jgi:hypothetical protein